MKVVLHVAANDELFLCTQTIDECTRNFQKKAPSAIPVFKYFLKNFPLKIIPAIHIGSEIIRDETDQPILNAALFYNIDIIITGDKDFLSLEIERPKCMTPSQYIEKFISAN